MNNCLFAYTGPTPRFGQPYPAFINVSRDKEGIRIMVRSDGQSDASCIYLTSEQAKQLFEALA